MTDTSRQIPRVELPISESESQIRQNRHSKLRKKRFQYVNVQRMSSVENLSKKEIEDAFCSTWLKGNIQGILQKTRHVKSQHIELKVDKYRELLYETEASDPSRSFLIRSLANVLYSTKEGLSDEKAFTTHKLAEILGLQNKNHPSESSRRMIIRTIINTRNFILD